MEAASLLGWAQSGDFRWQKLMRKKKKRLASKKTKVSGRKAPPGADNFHRALFSLFLSAHPFLSAFLDPTLLTLPV